ncbi:MAG: alpha-glucosidase C-terminal domain-containing protein, partial [Turicibacter sp.]
FMMHGTPFIYQGQEIGMTNVKFDSVEDYQDVQTTGLYHAKIEQGMSHDDMMEIVWSTSRGHSRTPMQWNNSENAGFTTGTPWMKMNPNYTTINVESELAEPNSILNFYKKMIKTKKANPVFSYGTYDLVLEDHTSVYAYTRTFGEQKAIILCNLSDKEVEINDLGYLLIHDNLLLANYKVESHEDLVHITFKPFETRIYSI